MVQRRIDAGETIVGKKVGATSAAVMTMLGLDQPDFGQLLSGMVYGDGDTIKLDSLIQPRAEGEIAFVLKHDLAGPGVTAIDVLRATDYVVPCFEIVDSRIDNWDIKVVDTIADNASCGAYVLGSQRTDPLDVDLALVGMTIDVANWRADRHRRRRGREGLAGQLADLAGQHTRRAGDPLPGRRGDPDRIVVDHGVGQGSADDHVRVRRARQLQRDVRVGSRHLSWHFPHP